MSSWLSLVRDCFLAFIVSQIGRSGPRTELDLFHPVSRRSKADRLGQRANPFHRRRTAHRPVITREGLFPTHKHSPVPRPMCHLLRIPLGVVTGRKLKGLTHRVNRAKKKS
ncbi:hypothetical protein K2X85_04510 [bacterium]|nr:hypothetical protein [bacterium]